MAQRAIWYFSGTHWDREWYQTFQGFRLSLVEALDGLIEALEANPDYAVFHLDGQTIVLDDYLAIRPERRARLTRLIEERRILIGPWYTMPDEQIVAGESLIRNLMLGREKCREYGVDAWNCGYICDIFGHIAQMPQIFNGFGIDTAVLGRGTNQHRTDTFFLWRAGADSACRVYKLPEFMGYGSFATEVIGEAAAGEALGADTPEFAERARAYVDREFARNKLPLAVVWDAMDHEPAHPDVPAYLDRLRELYPDAEVRCADLLTMFDRVPRSGLPSVSGELIEAGKTAGAHHHVLRHVLSSRIDVKRANDRAECRLAELEAYAVLYRRQSEPTERYLAVLWESLLQNHAHDSICGCGRDRIHAEMFYRTSQIMSFYEAYCERAERREAGGLRLIGKEGGAFVVVNPRPQDREAFVRVELPFDPAYPAWHEPFGYEERAAFRLLDETGAEIPFTVLRETKRAKARLVKERMIDATRVEIGFRARLAALGTTRFRIVPSDKPVRESAGMARDCGHALDNGIIRLSAASDGELTLTTASGQRFEFFLRFVDDSEIGDGWNSVRMARDERAVSARLCSLAVTHDSPVYSELRLRFAMTLPARAEHGEHGQTRSAETKELPIELRLGLAAGDRFVRAALTVDNCVCDHRLRLRVKTVRGQTWFANQAFDFVERRAGVDPETLDWKETDAPERSTAGIVGKTDGAGRGLAVFAKYGVRECSADAEDGLCLTLLRGFTKTHTTEGEPDGEVLGRQEYEFEFHPIERAPDAALQNAYDAFRAELRAFATERMLPSAVRVDDTLCVGAVKPAADGSGDVIVRCYNPADAPATGRVTVRGATGAVRTNLAEEVIGDIDPAAVTLGAKEIVTLRFCIGEES